jgi:hypothetical protein
MVTEMFVGTLENPQNFMLSIPAAKTTRLEILSVTLPIDLCIVQMENVSEAGSASVIR